MRIESPSVTVLMSVYNNEDYVAEAVESILTQTYCDFEFLIVNDASNDRTVEILQSYDDDRIRLIHNRNNMGLTASLNIGLLESSGKYIARIDADDIATVNRLEEQILYLEANPGIGVLGAWFRIIPDDIVGKHPCVHEDIYAKLFFSNALCHSTVVLRKSVLDNYHISYNELFTKSQDYELWSRMIELTDIANMPKVLVYYRTHKGQISMTSLTDQINFSSVIRTRLFNNLISLDEGSFINLLNKLSEEGKHIENHECRFLLKLYSELSESRLKNKRIGAVSFRNRLRRTIFLNLRNKAFNINWTLFFEILTSKLFRGLPRDKKIKICKRCTSLLFQHLIGKRVFNFRLVQ